MQLTLTPVDVYAQVSLDEDSAALVSFIRSRVKPTVYRHYDHQRGSWLVHWRYLPQVVQAARSLGMTVDWGALPSTWQMHIAGAQIAEDVPAVVVLAPDNPRTVLFVTDDAPFVVVRAAYKALVKLYHPDIGGGDAAMMVRVNAAYAAVQQEMSTADE